MSARPVQSSTELRVPVKVWLRGSTYRRLLGLAAEQGLTEVGALLEQMGENATGVALNGRKVYVRMTPAKLNRLVTLHQQGATKAIIARELGVSEGSVRGHLKRLNLTGAP